MMDLISLNTCGEPDNFAKKKGGKKFSSSLSACGQLSVANLPILMNVHVGKKSSARLKSELVLQEVSARFYENE